MRDIIALQHGPRMRVEGQDQRLQMSLRSQLRQVLKEKTVPFVHPVKKSYGSDALQVAVSC